MDYISISDEQRRRAIETATRNAQASIAWRKEETQPDGKPDKARLLAALEQIERMTLQARADSPDQACNWFSHIRSVAGIARRSGGEVKALTEINPSDWTPEPWFLKHDGWTIRAVAEPQDRICHTYTPTDNAATIARQVANANRIVECVNACTGMVDPVSEIAQLRAAIAKATSH